MSIYVSKKEFMLWLQKAMTSTITVNAVRKDLLEQLSGFVKLFGNEESVKISKSHYATILSFLSTQGKSEELSNDPKLAFIKTLLELVDLVQTPDQVIHNVVNHQILDNLINQSVDHKHPADNNE